MVILSCTSKIPMDRKSGYREDCYRDGRVQHQLVLGKQIPIDE